MPTWGITVSDLVSRVLVDLSDPNQRRWTSGQIVKFVNEGVRQFADAGIFRKVDYQVPTAGKAYYTTFAEPHRILSVAYDGDVILRVDRAELGYSTTTTDGTPTYYVATHDGIMVDPPPASAGTSLTFVSSPNLTEAQGFQITGDGYSVALDSTTYKHFHDHDGVCDSAITASDNLRIEYSYYPRDLESADTCPSRYVDALVMYATWRAFNLSNVAEEVARAQVLLPQWENLKRRVIGDKRPQMMGSLETPMEVY